MSITVKDILQLNCTHRFRQLTGQKGLDRPVDKVGILDWESGQVITDSFVPGEFVVTSLLAIKDDIDAFMPMLEALIQAGTGGVAIKTVYFSNLPDYMLAYAEDRDYPVFLFDETYMEDIITSVVEVVRESEELDMLSVKVDQLLSGQLSPYFVKKLALEINPYFAGHHQVVYCQSTSKHPMTQERMSAARKIIGKHNRMLPYGEGVLFIHTSRGKEGQDDQALYAFQYAQMKNQRVLSFKAIGTGRLLLPLMDNPWAQRYHDQIIQPIMAYDRDNGADLLQTAITYVDQGLDVKETAKALYQHGNTIRYRLDRIKKILGDRVDEKHFTEELLLAIRLHTVLNQGTGKRY